MLILQESSGSERADRLYNAVMSALPTLSCPRCRRPAEYQATLEVLDPPVGKIDVGHCADCRCLFERVRDTGTAYDSTTWLPVCRSCRQPVAVVALEGTGPEMVARYRCREHEAEVWEHRRQGDQWHRR